MSATGKTELRRAMRHACAAIDDAGRQAASQEVIRHIESLPEWRAAQVVALYSPLDDEVALGGLAGRWLGVKTIVLPVVEDSGMSFREWTGTGAMRRGAFGIMEPSGGEDFPPEKIDLVVVPGVAFSRTCQRLGRGKGYYDRFLKTTRAFRAGVCFSHALVDDMACELHDVDMDAVISPEGVIRK